MCYTNVTKNKLSGMIGNYTKNDKIFLENSVFSLDEVFDGFKQDTLGFDEVLVVELLTVV